MNEASDFAAIMMPVLVANMLTVMFVFGIILLARQRPGEPFPRLGAYLLFTPLLLVVALGWEFMGL